MRLIALPFFLFAFACAATAQTPPDVLAVRAILPDPQAFEVPPALEQIEDHSVVLLDLTMSVEAYPSFENADGTFTMVDGDCEFDGRPLCAQPAAGERLRPDPIVLDRIDRDCGAA